MRPASIPVHAVEVKEQTESPGKAAGKHCHCKTGWGRKVADEV